MTMVDLIVAKQRAKRMIVRMIIIIIDSDIMIL